MIVRLPEKRRQLPAAGSVLIGSLACLVYAVACGGSPAEPDPDLCPSLQDLQIYGCAIVRGTVSDADGAPVTGVIVGPRYGEEEACCNTVYSTTGATGSYEFRLLRHLPPPEGQENAAGLYVHVQQPGVGALDSVFVEIQFAPVGTAATVNVVKISVPVL